MRSSSSRWRLGALCAHEYCISRRNQQIDSTENARTSSSGSLGKCRAWSGSTVGQMKELLADQIAEAAEWELDRPAVAQQDFEAGLFPAVEVPFFVEPGDHAFAGTAGKCSGVDLRFAHEGEGQDHQVLARRPQFQAK